MGKKLTGGFSSVVFMLACFATRSLAQSVTVTTDHPDGIYAVGQSVHWTVHVESKPTAPLKYSVHPGQGRASTEGQLDFSSDNSARIDYPFKQPSTVILQIGESVGGAIADPGHITPSAKPPADFNAFWKSKLDELQAVAMHLVVTPADSPVAGVHYEKLTMDNIRGKTIHAQLARPMTGEKFPALLIVQWAGVYRLDKSWVTDRAREGWLALDVMPHDLPIDQQPEFYKAQFEGPLKNYWALGNDNRETSYYLPMYLSCYRAAEYLRTRPDWDGKTLVVMGGSQGGQQALMIAGLDPVFTAAMANVPAGCDMLGPAVARKGGWPQWYDWTAGKDPAKVHEASSYFDVVNFAGHIKCQVLVGSGLLDQVSPSAGVCAAFNQIHAPKELVLMPHSAHQSVNDSQADYDHRLWNAWLPDLVKGKLPALHGSAQ